MRVRALFVLLALAGPAASSAPPPVAETAYRADPAPAAAPLTGTPAATTPAPTPAPTPSAAPTPTRTAAPTTRAAVTPAPPKAGRPLTAEITFYAAGDNDPAGSTDIAFPGTRHGSAGGVGTFDDPVTLASDPDHLAVGTVVYHPGLRKYFVMEDICAQCTNDWSGDGRPHIDLWTGDDEGSGITACEHALTPAAPVTVELDAPRGRPVDTTPLYADGRCAG